MEVDQVSEFKTIDFIYFNFLFTFIFFLLFSMLENSGLRFSMISQSHISHMSHDTVTAIVTQSHGYNRILLYDECVDRLWLGLGLARHK